jgi:hypothetical protein
VGCSNVSVEMFNFENPEAWKHAWHQFALAAQPRCSGCRVHGAPVDDLCAACRAAVIVGFAELDRYLEGWARFEEWERSNTSAAQPSVVARATGAQPGTSGRSRSR